MKNINTVLARHGLPTIGIVEKVQHSGALDRLSDLEKRWQVESLTREPSTTENEPKPTEGTPDGQD